ncbi:MAG: hypothetical protein M3Q19_09205 [Pseudomonadota bacterium]|nr:hypothetical protein [Pseudomonadota bacterium]
MPVKLPAGTSSLPPLGGRFYAAYRLTWWLLLFAALAAVAWSWIEPTISPEILGLRLAKSAVLVAVATILFRRRGRDPVAAMLSLAFLMWTISSSVDIAAASIWAAVLDRGRFLLFASALLLFPNGEWRPRWTQPTALIIAATFFVGIGEAIGLIASSYYLPVAIGCVLTALVALLARYRSIEAGVQRQQLKWVTLGLVIGIALILSARAGSELAAGKAMPIIGMVAIEGLFQLGIIVLALGFLISLLRYRLYDAETAISRSAAYAGLTLALVGTFAASEALIQTLGQRYFGAEVGDLSGGIAAAIAAVLLTPLHSRIRHWAEQRFQHDLAAFKQELPDLLISLSAGSSIERLAATVLPRIEQAVQSTRIALLVDNRLVAAQGINSTAARRLLKDWRPPATAELIGRDDDEAFPLRMALRCPLGNIRGWLLLGPRPDGSYYGKDDVEALTAIALPLQRTLFQVAEREREERGRKTNNRELRRALRLVSARVSALERLS